MPNLEDRMQELATMNRKIETRIVLVVMAITLIGEALILWGMS